MTSLKIMYILKIQDKKQGVTKMSFKEMKELATMAIKGIIDFDYAQKRLKEKVNVSFDTLVTGGYVLSVPTGKNVKVFLWLNDGWI